MKRNLFLCVFLSLVACSCTLENPPRLGEKCEGAKKINYSKSDACANDVCPDHLAALEMGFCPINYRCVSGSEESYCQMDCDTASGLIMCDGKCINPDQDDEYCGAKGKCENKNPQNEDYFGENCKSKGDKDNRYYCLAGHCELNECEVGQHAFINANGVKDCEPDSNNACGSATHVCEGHEHCIAGKCVEDCGTEGQILCEQKCVDPNNSREYCGARLNENGECEYQNCGNGGICNQGTCEVHSCLNVNEKRCTVDGVEQCVDVLSDVNRCGGCDNRCENNIPDNGELVSCTQGKCIYQCINNNDIASCKNGDILKCPNIKKDFYNCGSCGHQCGEKQVCNDGTCEDNPCEGEYQCYVGQSCVEKRKEHCGKNCVNCIDRETTHASDATCDEVGKCHTVKCYEGYHLVLGMDDEFYCEENTDTSCGSVDMDNAVDCTKMPDSTGGTCDVNAGKCQLNCKYSHHYYDDGETGVCEENSIYDCLEHGKACSAASAKTMRCDNTRGCLVNECDTDYHIKSDYLGCEKNSLTSCGLTTKTGVNCNNVVGWGWKTVECRIGQCIPTSCVGDNGPEGQAWHLFNNRCVPVCHACGRIYYNNDYCCMGGLVDHMRENCTGDCYPVTNNDRCLKKYTDNINYENIVCVDSISCEDIEYDRQEYPETFSIDNYLDSCFYYK